MSNTTYAARYEWLRERFTQLVISTEMTGPGQRIVTMVDVNYQLSVCDPDTVDAAIDAAMVKTTPCAEVRK